MKKRYILLVLILGFVAIFFVFFNKAAAPVIEGPHKSDVTDALAPEAPLAQKDDLIIVESPRPGSTVGKTFVVKGKARGQWYFEGSFPVTLTDVSGKVLVQTYAKAQGEWMTKDYVPFTSTIVLPDGIPASRGILILKKDNPSDNPALDNQLTLPVIFT